MSNGREENKILKMMRRKKSVVREKRKRGQKESQGRLGGGRT